MSTPLLYRPKQRWQIWAAFLGAALIHLGAVALATTKTTDFAAGRDNGATVDVELDPATPAQTPSDATEAPSMPAVEPPDASVEDDFAKEENTSPVQKTLVRPVRPVTKIRAVSAGGSVSMRNARVLAVSAPQPQYPYDARRQRITGSGIAVLTIDPRSGLVLDVTMTQSTGSSLLDSATTSAFRRWRFRPASVSKVQTPITFTLTGASY